MGSLLGGGKGGGGGGSQSDAAIRAAEIAVGAQREQLEYLKEREEVPQQYREQATRQLGESLEGFTPQTREQLLAGIEDDPLYRNLISSGEEAVLRNRAVTGSLRGGGTVGDLAQIRQSAFTQTYQDRQRDQASQLGSLRSLAGLPDNTAQIANVIGQIGQTQAAGITSAAAAQAQGQQQGLSNLLGLGQLGLSAYSAFSDPRLKENIKQIRTEHGVKIYSWDWNELAKRELGLEGSDEGVLTSDHPECCKVDPRSGYMLVDYRKVFLKELENA